MAANSGPRWLAFVLALIGIVTLIIAVVHTPIGEWGAGGYVFGGAVLVITLIWLVLGFRGSFNLLGKLSPRDGMIVNGIGAVAVGIVLGVTIFSDEWTIQNVLTAGMGAQLAVMFIAGFYLSSQNSRAAG